MTFYTHRHNFHIYLPRIFKCEVEPVPDEGRRDIKPVLVCQQYKVFPFLSRRERHMNENSQNMKNSTEFL